ncbi:MAG: DUF402 domain-containing protein [Ilumatobacteraceae bacterium]
MRDSRDGADLESGRRRRAKRGVGPAAGGGGCCDAGDREFVCWYLNLQTAFVRTADGYRTQDLELDLVVFPDGSHVVKDAEVLDDRVAEGRYSPELVAWIRSHGDGLIRRLETDGPWWDRSWVDWEPDPGWDDTTFRR